MLLLFKPGQEELPADVADVPVAKAASSDEDADLSTNDGTHNSIKCSPPLHTTATAHIGSIPSQSEVTCSRDAAAS